MEQGPEAGRLHAYRGGRRIALHEYPYRDDPWPVDTGRATRRITVTGFLLRDDVFDQRTALIAALEQKGPGTLVHRKRWSEALEQGLYCSMDLSGSPVPRHELVDARLRPTVDQSRDHISEVDLRVDLIQLARLDQ